MNNLNRRSFINQGLAAVATAGLAPIASGSMISTMPSAAGHEDFYRFQIGLAAYSFRKHFPTMKGKPNKAIEQPPIDMFQFVEFCAKHRIAGAELTAYFFPPDADAAYFRQLKNHSFRHGVTICGTAIGNNFSRGPGDDLDQEIKAAKQWIDRASELGAPHIRFFAGTAKDFAAGSDRMKFAIEALQECVDYAGQRGIFIGVENHGKLTAAQMIEIVNGVQSDWFGINLDTGNFQSEDPYADLVRCAPHAVNIQLKVKMRSPEGVKYDADLERIGEILRQAHYKGFVVLEFEEDDPMTNVPVWVEKLHKALA